ncbi:MAG: hypothetical protein WA081_12755 [Desulfosalsimonadaceae bacterium]
MDNNALLEKYHHLLSENSRLREENHRLKVRLGITESKLDENGVSKTRVEEILPVERSSDRDAFSDVTNASNSLSKIRRFMSLFKGRDDVYAKRWWSKKNNSSGYSPVCLNQWQTGVCGKPKAACAGCPNKAYAPLDEHVVEDHLRGNITAGVYPLLPDETCFFLAMDFDETDWRKDISARRLRRVYDSCGGGAVAIRKWWACLVFFRK